MLVEMVHTIHYRLKLLHIGDVFYYMPENRLKKENGQKRME